MKSKSSIRLVSVGPIRFCRATALFNAVKKQFGLDVYLLHLALPSPPPPPVPVPLQLPRLPRPTLPESPPMMRNPKRNSTNGPVNASLDPASPNTLRLVQSDIQQTSKFAREFVVGCLIPWMEKNVLEWSEAVGLDSQYHIGYLIQMPDLVHE